MKRIVGLLVAALWASVAVAYDPSNGAEYLAKIKEAEVCYNNKCATVAGEKIYKIVPDVEGISVMKVRPRAVDREYGDPNWPGAAFALETYQSTFGQIGDMEAWYQSLKASGKLPAGRHLLVTFKPVPIADEQARHPIGRQCAAAGNDTWRRAA